MSLNHHFKTYFPAMYSYNFRLYFIGQCLSTTGTWMQSFAQSWLVLELTKSNFLLGALSATQFLPMLLFSLFGGTLADYLPKKKILLITQTCFALLAGILAFLTFTNQVEYWMILILTFINGTLSSIDMPTRQAFFSEVVSDKDLSNAIMLNSSVFNLSRLIGPAIATFTIGLFGLAPCFAINSFSYIAVIIALLMMKMPIKTDTKKLSDLKISKVFKDMKLGLIYAYQTKSIFLPALTILAANIILMNYGITLPIYAREALKQGVGGYGMLNTCLGFGSLITAIAMAMFIKGKPTAKILYGSGLLLALSLLLLGINTDENIAFPLMIIVGVANIALTISVNATMQLNATKEMRGRVMGVYSFIFGGTTPFGSLFTGIVSQFFGIAICLQVSGISAFLIILAIAIFFVLLSKKQPDLF